MRIAIFGEPGDAQARNLAKRMTARGATCAIVPLSACAIVPGPVAVSIPGVDGLPDAIFVRSVQAGSFEEVTMRLGILHLLREAGVLVWNDARTIERCVDKSMTTALLAAAGIATPKSWATQRRDMAVELAQAAKDGGGKLVLKPLFGSQGKGLRLIAGPSDIPEHDAVAGVWYLQEFVETGDGTYHDHRLLVCAGAVIGAMTRRSEGWVTNIRQGARAFALAAPPAMQSLAIAAAAATGADYAGVDIIVGRDGRARVLEVNSMPAWSGLQSVSRSDIPAAIASAFLAAARRHLASRVERFSS
jgi:RimK family alpha-L-glutamate ligase